MDTLIHIGETLGREPRKRFGVFPPDRLLHQFIIGQTGTGKSTLLLNMALQDRASGQGFCLIDPHGDLARQLEGNDDTNVVYWDVANPSCLYGYNPLTHVTAEYRSLVVSGLIDTLKKQWADAWGARMEHLLRYSLLALLERPHSTMEHIIPMFLDPVFRRQILSSVTDTYVRQFWTVEYPAMNYTKSADGVAPIANKIGAFLANPVVRKALCAPEKPLRFRRVMDDGQTLIVNLSKGKLGADISNVLGGLVVSSLAHAAYSRQNEPEALRRPFILYIDEFHSFTTSAIGDMLSELRKYGLALVLSSQHTSQIETPVLEAILGNVGTIMAFRVGATDAAILARQFGADIPSARDLVGLPNYEMYVKLMINGQQSKPFSARSLPPDSMASAA